MKKRKIIISGGGTGGHIFPAIAIADALKNIDPAIDILFVGAKGKMEMTKVPQAGYRIEGLWISGFQRSLTLKNLLFPVKLLVSLWKAHQIVRRFQPDAVVGVGGYASGPTVDVATKKGIISVVQEQNSYAGVTNRLLAKKVEKVCVAYEGMETFFPKEKIVFTGNPVRESVTKIQGKKQEAITYFKLDPKKRTIVAMGGSLGARTINESIELACEWIQKSENVQLLWQVGKLYAEEFKEKLTAKLPNVQLVEFIDRMDLAYAVADVIVARAGAITISELCLVKKAAILVPSPNVAEDHQTKNAMALVNKNAAWLVKDQDARSILVKKALELVGDAETQAKLSSNIATLARTNAAENIAKVVIELIENQRTKGKNEA